MSDIGDTIHHSWSHREISNAPVEGLEPVAVEDSPKVVLAEQQSIIEGTGFRATAQQALKDIALGEPVGDSALLSASAHQTAQVSSSPNIER